MTDPHLQLEPQARRPHRLGAVALLTALAFGCTTVRQPVSLIQGPVQVRDGVVDPQLELWLESARTVTPAESAAATAAAREALADALRGRRIADGSLLLVVREQGVSRTDSHRRDQAAATVGMVVGAVVVVAAVLVAASSKGGSGGHAPGRPSAPAWRGAHAAGATPPVVSPALPVAAAARGAAWRPPPVRPPPVRPPPVRPGPVVHDHAPAVAVGVYVNPGPITWEPGPPPAGPGPAPEAWPAVPVGPELQGAPAEAPAPDAEPQAEVEPLPDVLEVALPDLPPYPVEERDFFSGDALVLEFTLVDEATGEPRWTKRVSAKADPCDREAVRRVVDHALDEAAGWIEVR